jgi:hypothetical protein
LGCRRLRLCHRATANAMLLPLPPLCRCHRPAAPLPATAKLPPPHPTPPLRCLCSPRAANAVTSLPTIAVPLPHCLRALPMLLLRIQRCHPAATAVAVLLPPPPLYRRHCCRPVTLLPHCSHHRRRCAVAATLALPTPPLCANIGLLY